MIIPNLAPEMNFHVLTLEEAQNISDDDFVWVELRHDNYNVIEDEVFCLRAQIVTGHGIDFSTPEHLIACYFEDYGNAWRVWNLYPDWETTAETEWER